jgi:hypothetical protein
MRANIARGVASICFLAVYTSASMASRQSPPPAPAPTIRVQSSLVLVDVISQDRNSGLPVRDFKKEDFRLFDNGHEVRIATFDAGARYDARPITLWLVVICNEGGLPKFGASAEFLGQESLFRPALDRLEAHDRVGVAHWCDNGDSRLDLLPREDRDKAVQALAETLKPIPFDKRRITPVVAAPSGAAARRSAGQNATGRARDRLSATAAIENALHNSD